MVGKLKGFLAICIVLALSVAIISGCKDAATNAANQR